VEILKPISQSHSSNRELEERNKDDGERKGREYGGKISLNTEEEERVIGSEGLFTCPLGGARLGGLTAWSFGGATA